MLEYLSANWLWILLIGGFLFMHFGHGGHGGHGRGGCGGHGGDAHGTDQHQHEHEARDAAKPHSPQQRDAPEPGYAAGHLEAPVLPEQPQFATQSGRSINPLSATDPRPLLGEREDREGGVPP